MSVSDLIKRLEAFSTKAVYVGIPKEKNPTTEEGFRMSDLAAVHEFGSPDRNIPERSFLRASVSNNQGRYFKFLSDRLIKGGGEPEKILNELSVVAQDDVREYIVNGKFAPLSEKTVKRKGSSKPLIDTGRLRQSIVGVVRDEN